MNNHISKFIAQRIIFTASEVFPNLYQASKVRNEEDVEFIKDLAITSIVDLEGGFDLSMPFLENYLLWPIHDYPFLPNLNMLLMVSEFIACQIGHKRKVLVHCSQGLNRSGLVCARVMALNGIPGTEAINRIRNARPGALWNPVFAAYINSLP